MTTSNEQDEDDNTSEDPIAQNIAAVVAIYQQSEEHLAVHQRLLERFAGMLARPAALLLLLGLVSFWIGGNVYLQHVGKSAPDPPPFSFLQGTLTLCSLMLAAIILVAQNREGKADQRRAHLELQINLLTEQRSAKIISLLEELRRDMPTVKDRVDAEAEILSSPGSPHAILEALDGQMAEVEESGGF